MVTWNLAGARMFPRTGCFTPFRLSTIRQRANFEQVKAGLAWHYKANQADQAVAYRERYAAAEISAGQANLLLSRG